MLRRRRIRAANQAYIQQAQSRLAAGENPYYPQQHQQHQQPYYQPPPGAPPMYNQQGSQEGYYTGGGAQPPSYDPTNANITAHPQSTYQPPKWS